MDVRLLSLLLSLFTHGLVSAQETWNLAECIDQAVRNNIGIKRTQLNAELAYAEYGSEKSKLLPTLSFFQSGGMLFGRSIDPVTNFFAERQIGYQSLGLQTNLPIINYFRQKHTIKASKHRLSAEIYNSEADILNLKVQVLSQFSHLVETKRQLEIFNEQIELLLKELSIFDSLLKNGRATKITQLKLESKLKADSMELVLMTRDFTNSKLEFLRLLNLPQDQPFEINDSIRAITIPDFPPVDLLVDQLKSVSPSLLAAMEEKAAIQHEIKFAKLASYPSFSLNLNLMSNYSSAYLNNAGHVYPYLAQIKNNLSRNVSLSVSIPIFSQNTGKYSQKVAKLKMTRHTYETAEKLQQLETRIRAAYNNLRSAREELKIGASNLKTIRDSFELTSILFRAGKASAVEYLTSLNEVETSKMRNVILTTYIFRLESILELYFGSFDNH